MESIKVQILNPESIRASEYAMLAAARLTQRGEKIENMEDFMALYNKPLDKKLVKSLCALPHPTIQKFGIINVMVVGLSRRALAQITRHQNEVKFMSSSLQYSDYSTRQMFVTPEGLPQGAEDMINGIYASCAQAYDRLIKMGASPDQAGYVLPQGLKGCLLISATPYQWKHMISQRTCRRNTPEVRYIFLETWRLLNNIAPELFGDAGPFCLSGKCAEGKMSCGVPCISLKEELEELKNED